MSNPAREIAEHLRVLYQPGDVFEVRAPKCLERRGGSYTSTQSGYYAYDEIDTCAEHVAALDRSELAPGIYATINPVRPDLIARSANRIQAKARETTQDKDIVARRWLLIDADPVRPAGISATDTELEAARAAADRIAAELPWPSPIRVMSGNGYHLYYAVDLPADDDGLVQRVLAALADHYSTPAVAIDRSVFNPARITKIAGTMARKGDDLRGIAGVEDRPHRRAELIDVPEHVETVPRDALELVAGTHATPPPATGARLDGTVAGVRDWLESHGVTVKSERHTGDRTMLALTRCAVDPSIESSGASDICVCVSDGGVISYHNRHNRGVGMTWHDVREALEPARHARPGVDVGPLVARLCGEPEQPEVTPPDRRYRLVQAARMTLARPTWLIPRILEADSLAMVFGDPGCGKSFLAIDWASRIASGASWRDREVKQGAVIYVAGEGKHGLSRRLTAWATHHGHDLARMPLYVGGGFSMTDLFALGEFVEAIEAESVQPALIVLDTLARCFGGDDENSTQDMGRFVMGCDNLRDRFGCTVLVVHHSGHADKSRARGAMAMKGAVDAEYRVAKLGDAVTVHQTKAKDGEPCEPMGFTVTTVEIPGLVDDDGEPVTSAVLVDTTPDLAGIMAQAEVSAGHRPAPRQAQALAVLEMLATATDGPVTTDAWRDGCVSDGMPRQRFAQARTALLKRGVVQAFGPHVRVATSGDQS